LWARLTVEIFTFVGLTQIKAADDDRWLDPLGSNIEVAIMINTRQLETIVTGVVAGAAGGLAEIAWVTLYAGITGGDPAVLARGVTTAAGVSALLPAASPVVLGIGVHMMLAAMLGVVLTFAWQALSAKGLTNSYPFMLAALTGVWAMNFFLVLPTVSPAFVHLVPYAVSLTSKLLFGVAAAEVVRDRARFIVPAPALAFRKVGSPKV
jgi:hypothetical protein